MHSGICKTDGRPAPRFASPNHIPTRVGNTRVSYNSRWLVSEVQMQASKAFAKHAEMSLASDDT